MIIVAIEENRLEKIEKAHLFVYKCSRSDFRHVACCDGCLRSAATDLRQIGADSVDSLHAGREPVYPHCSPAYSSLGEWDSFQPVLQLIRALPPLPLSGTIRGFIPALIL